MKCLITGASSGLGLEVGNLLEQNYQVVNLSRKESPFENIFLDLSDNESITQTIEEIKDKHSQFDVLVLNSGIMPLAPVGEIDFDVDNMFKVNITGTIKLVNGLIDLIKENKADVVIANDVVVQVVQSTIQGLVKSPDSKK